MAARWNSHELQVVHEWIHRDSQTRPLGTCMRYCPYYCYRRTCVVALYVTLAWSIVLAVIILIACGILIVEPWRHTLRYQEARCRVEKSEYTGETIGCRCGQYCRSHFPCLRVTVTYVPVENGGDRRKEVRTMLYESEFDRELSGTVCMQARIQGFLGGARNPPPHGCLQYFFYIQTHRC